MNFLFKISSIALALMFVITINFKTVITASYFVNQTEIIELFCINKEKPQLQCNGKCHLARQLTEIVNETKETPFPPSSLESNIEISYSLSENDITILSNSSKLLSQCHFKYTPLTSDGYSSILSPPPRG